MIDESVNKKKVKKLIRKEQIVAKISKQSFQNAASLKTRCIEIMKPEAKILTDMKIKYSAIFDDFTLTQFSTLIYALKVNYNNYRRCTITEYYKMLGIATLYNKFIKAFFKRLK